MNIDKNEAPVRRVDHAGCGFFLAGDDRGTRVADEGARDGDLLNHHCTQEKYEDKVDFLKWTLGMPLSCHFYSYDGPGLPLQV